MARILWGGILFVSLLLTGCAVNEEPSIDLPPLTLPAPLESTFSGSCADTRLLESWLQTAYFQYEDFLDLINAASGQSPDDLYADVERMADLRDAVNAQSVPDCAVAAHMHLLEAMDGLIPDLARYVNGEDVDVAAQVTEIQPALTAFLEQHEVLSDRLELQYRDSG